MSSDPTSPMQVPPPLGVPASSANTTGAVYDRGYRPYDGERGGRRSALMALTRASMRRALGFRRPWKMKLAPFVLLAIVTIPAIVNVGVGYVTRDSVANRIEIITYRNYVGVSSALLLFVALVAPDLLCPDRRHHVLPLLFSRPLTGLDYVVAKVVALTTILFAFSFLPQVVLFLGNMLVSDRSLDYLQENADVLWQVPVSVFLLAVYYAVVSLAISALTDRRIVAGASIIGLFLVTSITAGILIEANETRSEGTLATLVNVLALPLEVRDLVFYGKIASDSSLSGVANGGLFAVGVYGAILLSAGALLAWRYRWVER
jgi:ABC-2 type transport system permease protein